MKKILKRQVKALVALLAACVGGVASAAPRTLDVSSVDSRYFVDANGKTYIPVGCNICFPRMYDAASPGSRAACEEKFFGWLRAFAANGGNFVRLWLGHPFFEIMPEQAGKYDPAAEATLKKTVALCEELGIKLKLTLESFRTVHPVGKEGKGMYSAFFNRPLYAPYAKNMREFLHSEKCARFYLGKAQRLKELGLGDSPAVACWELWNEINCIGSWRGDVGPWSDRMLEELRAMFPRQMTVQNLGSFSGPSAYDYYDYLGRIPLNHFMQVHRYLDPGAELDICRGPMDVLAADAVKELLDRRPDAPAVLAEVGAVKPNHTGPSELYAKDKHGMLLHDEIFAPFFAGSAGCGQPWHWDHQYVNGNNLWWHFARFAMAVKGIDPALERFRPFHTETRRLRVWGLRGMNTTLLWCRDKANTWESELVRGEPPATISGEKIPFAKSFTCYLPWENRWADSGKGGTLPDFKRSIVVRIMHETEWEKPGASPGARSTARDVMEPLPPGAVTLTGGLEVPIEKSIAHWHKGNVPYREFAEFFRKGRPKFALGEMWGKFVRSGAMQYRHRRDPELKAVLDGAVADILATERPNGSISCVPEELQPGGDGHSRPHCSDLWERKYVMLALEDYYEWVERRPEVLASLRRQADCLIRQVGPAPKRDIREIGWSPNCIESSSLLEPFMRLYKLTRRKEYLDFARYIVESGGAKGSDLFAQARAGVMPWRMGEPYPKAYEMTSIFEGLAEWHRVTGDEPAREAVVKYFDSVLRHEITIVGNGGGNYPHWPKWSGEAWDNTAAEQSNPDMTRMMETCVGVTWMKYASQVLRLTGDVRAADAIELYVYNGLLGAMKPDGDGFSYVNLLNGEKVTNKGWGWTFASGPVTCCNLNGPMGLAYIPFVAVMQAQDGPVVNLYNAGTAVAKTASGGDVRLAAEGDLLDRDGWRMTVSPSRAEHFTISLRIPAWSEKTSVTVNGKSVGGVAPGEYLKIDRKWRAGDKVAVTFDFKARKLDAPVGRNHASAPFQAVTWGPIALARDENTDPNYAAPVAIQAAADGTVAVERITPASPAHKLEFRVPTKDGFITMCDYASVDGWKGKHVQTWLPKDRRSAVAAASLADDALVLPNGRRITRSMITGHRGDAQSVPENTLMAFRRAVDNGFCFECDFYMTNDGEVYCVHDMNLKRTFGIAGRATNVCWKGTLDKVDVGAVKGPQFAGRADCRVPRIDEVFALVPDDGRKITLEVKDPRPEIVPLIQAAWRRHPNMKEENIIFLAHKATRAALVKAFPRATFQHCVNCYSDGWRKGCTPIPAARQLAELDARPECRNFSPMFDLDLLTPDYISAVHRRGVTFYTWCVDRPEDAVEVFGRGVDGVCSNCPVELWEGLKAICAAPKTAGYAEARVDEIAGWLPERPAAPGARIGDRTTWGHLAALPSAAARIRAAEKMLSDPIPELTDDMYMEFSRSGNRSRYRQRYDRLYFGLADLTLGECLENKGRFLSAIVAHIEAICSLRSWTYPAHDPKLLSFNGSPHIDVGSARLTAYLALTYDWLRDVLPSETRARLLAECDRRSFQPYLATCRNFSPKDSVMARRNWWYHAENNWNSACNSGVVRAALAMVEDRRLRAEFVAAAEEAVPYAMRGYLSDGYCTEGMGYWGYGYGNLLMLGLTVRAATGGKVDFFTDLKHRAVMMFPYGNRLMEWKSPHFADYAANPSLPLLALERQVFPDITSRRASGLDLLAGDEGYAHSDLTFIALRAFGQEPAPDGAEGFDALPPRTWFPEGQVLIARGEWPERTMRLSVAIKGGHNGELHNHNDVGSYVLMLDGDEMGGDPGPEVYRAQTFSKDRYLSKVLNSYGHPVPVVGGQLQETGRAAAAKIVKTDFTDARDEIVIDLMGAYSVPTLKSLVRTLAFDRTTATVTVSDAVTCSEPTAFEVPVITYRDYTKDEKGLQFAFRKKKGVRTLEMTVEASAPVTFRHETVENKPRPDVTRLGFAFTQPVTNATLSFVYTPSHKPSSM